MAEEKQPPAPGRDPKAWLALEKKDPRRAEQLWQALTSRERLRTILSAQGPERERLITMAQDARELVQALTPDEFTRTVLEVGPEDAGALLGLCSAEQITYLLDLTGWVQERFAPSRYQIWLPLLLDAGPQQLGRWLDSADLEVLTLLFAHWFKVVKYLPSQDEQEPPDDLPGFTLDGVYHLDFYQKEQAAFVAQVLVYLKSEKPEFYQTVMESMLWESTSQVAEDALRWRNGRLGDHGFPERLEALQLWAHLRPKETDWTSLPPKADRGFPPDPHPRSDAFLRLLPEDEALPVVAEALSEEAKDALRAELAYVANCGVVALGADPAQPKEVEQAARESLGLANLGLAVLSQGDAGRAGAILARVGMDSLARQGAAALRELNQGAFALLQDGWLKDVPNGFFILDPPLDRCLAGFLFQRPRCFDPSLKGGKEYRSFVSLADLEQARRHLEMAGFWGRILFEFMGIERGDLAALIEAEIWPADPRDRKISSVIGTWLARRALGLAGLAPLPRPELNRAVTLLQKGLKGPLAKELFKSCQTLADPKEAALAGQLLRGVLARLKDEILRLSPKMDLDPALVFGLFLKR